MTDSSTGGALLPTSPAPLNDLDLDKVFQALVVSLTGLAGPFVRPRWQAEPAPAPDFGATWAAVGVTVSDDDQFPVQSFDESDGLTLIRHERLDVLCSFYGPHAQRAARDLRDAIIINQNTDQLEPYAIRYAWTTEPIKAPELIQNRWTNRIDVTLTFKRQIERTYAVLALTDAVGGLVADAENLPSGIHRPLNTATRPN